MYWDSTIIILIPAIIFSIVAQVMVKSAFSEYSKVRNSRGLTGADAAREILDRNGLTNVRIEHISGSLTDHYDPKANVIRLSDDVYGSATVAAVGVAAHEAGHAVQYAEGYYPIKIRNAIIPVTRFGSSLSTPLVILGLVLSLDFLITAGILLFCAVVLFQAITLPVEFNASGRALKTLRSSHFLEDDEMKGARSVLTAAAMTYVAAMLSALLSLVRLLVISGRRRR
ncbi:MAG: zinc metallopeptidase [Oscillospiraceae bacterium]|nr:zinc metallopeptidase [Oscillospiraceae bacterium]MDD7278977.1 zinc metallopeptidase [Oscillospiraceae bacterium]MDY2864370.1 zinc metallopeptidase [Oscillospiraceae bacterium]